MVNPFALCSAACHPAAAQELLEFELPECELPESVVSLENQTPDAKSLGADGDLTPMTSLLASGSQLSEGGKPVKEKPKKNWKGKLKGKGKNYGKRKGRGGNK